MDGSEAVLHILLAESNSDRPHLEPSSSKSITMCSQSRGNVIEFSLDVHVVVPEAFANDAGTQGHLLVEVVAVRVLSPHAGLSANHIHICHAWLESVGLTPMSEFAVVDAIHVVEAEVEVNLIFIGKDDGVVATQDLCDVGTDAPPLDSVFFVHGQVDVFIGPVDHLLSTHATPNLLLLLAVDQGEVLEVSDVACSHPVSDALLGGPALMNSLISSQMNVLVVESLVNEVHNLLHHFIGEVDGGVELSHVDAVAVQSKVLVLWAAAPGASVSGSVDFRHYANGPITSVLDNVLDLCRRNQAAHASELAELRHIGDLHGEGILVDDVPVEHVEFGESH